MSTLVLSLIRLYQRTISPDHGWFSYRHPYGYCRLYPSCSEYTHRSISRHGLWRGSWLGMRRILRCNPWHEPGHDPVPDR
ncbi:MAG: membrane protein insertion efficiency factor YidD [Candidatus Kerfeldbacteria bacterium]|nr:membrane protein insertion efficiency factor YidD [Candidatus Kerfeldbacteria bacterium]